MQIEFFFDCSSPWTYLAFEAIQPLAAEFSVEIIWRPILVGGIFNQVNPQVDYLRQKGRIPKPKLDYMEKDIADWARMLGIKLICPPTGHPVNSVKVMRACLVLEPEGKLISFARATFQSYFGSDRFISDDFVIRDICESVDVDADWLLSKIQEQSVKDALRENVDEAIQRGAFGSPTYFLDRDDMYFGMDRLPLLRYAMIHKQKTRQS